MLDKPKLLKKLGTISHQATVLKNYLNGIKEYDFQKEDVFDAEHIMSEALKLVRDSTEFLQNVGTAWRKELNK